MPRLRVLLAGLVLLTGTVLGAGCARTDEQAASSKGVTTVTAPPVTSTPSAVAPCSSTTSASTPTTKPASAPLLVWPYTTSVNVANAVKVPPVPVLEHVRVGRHPGYDRIVFEFSGPLPGYRVQPVTTLAEDGSGEPVMAGLLQPAAGPAGADPGPHRQRPRHADGR